MLMQKLVQYNLSGIKYDQANRVLHLTNSHSAIAILTFSLTEDFTLFLNAFQKPNIVYFFYNHFFLFQHLNGEKIF